MRNSLLILSLFLSFTGFSQRTDRVLEARLREAVSGFRGDLGIYVKNLRTGKVVAIHADTVFPTASIVKVPILVGIVDKLEKGELRYSQSLIYKDSLLYAGEDILGSFKNNEKISLKKVIMLMMTTSDNTASLWLQSLAGTGTRINEIMDGLGLRQTRVNSRTAGREANRSQYGWGQTSPAEMGRLLELIYRGQVISPAASERIQRCMTRNFWDGEALSQIPPYVEVYSKNGAVNASRSEALLVHAGKNPYVFCFFTKNNQDQSWGDNNEAWVLVRKISAMVWRYHSPKDKWAPALK